MALTILPTAYSLAPVSPDAVGGSEQVLSALDAALVEAGHRSLVAACDCSRVQGRLFPFGGPPAGPITDEEKCCATTRLRGTMWTAMQEERIDQIHMHGAGFSLDPARGRTRRARHPAPAAELVSGVALPVRPPGDLAQLREPRADGSRA